MTSRTYSHLFPRVLLVGALALITSPVMAQGGPGAQCPDVSHNTLRTALQDAVQFVRTAEVGLGNDMWATIVNRDGVVCRVVFSGEDRDDQWPGSRVISAQKANTANAFSLAEGDGVGIALSTGNLYGVVLEQGSLFGLQHSNPVDTDVAYGPVAGRYGQPNDPMIGQFIGGVNVFGGGLGLYTAPNSLIGGLGVSGDTSCADHIIAWHVRNSLGLDRIPGGVGPEGTDNLNLPEEVNGERPVTPNTFEHPLCGFGEEVVIEALTPEPEPEPED